MTILGDVTIRPANSVVLFGDAKADPPSRMGTKVVSRSGSVLAIGTAAEHDSATRIRVATAPDKSDDRPKLAVFDGLLEIPGKRLVLSDVLGELYVDHFLDGTSERIRVWADSDREPRDIYILVG